MTAAPAIQVSNMGKRLRLRSRGRTLKSFALDLLRGGGANAGPRSFWALEDVNFEVARGETLGIIGANGAGKTTLLSLLAGTMLPTRGSIQTQGTVSSLLELGAGFHPDLTGRENVYLAGAIMGIPRARMKARFDAIVEFAGLSQFIDQPVKHYSSGMYVRLGFAVAVEVDPDILLIDEVLAVGDIDFQRKCIERMRSFHDKGKTMLIVSHDLPVIQALSDRILLLDHGHVLNIGRPTDVVGAYRTASLKTGLAGKSREWGSGEATLQQVKLLDAVGRETDTIPWGGTLRIRIQYTAAGRIERPVFGFSLNDAQGRVIFGSNTQIEQVDIPHIAGAGVLNLELPDVRLARGAYTLSLALHAADHKTNYHRLDCAFPFFVEHDKPVEGCLYVPSRWKTE